MARLQSVVTALIELRISSSLIEVDRALAQWRAGELGALAAHGALLKHAARCERTVERVGAAAGDRPEGILRDAVDAGILEETAFVALVGKPSAEISPAESLRDEESDGPNKRRAVEALLERGPVLLHLDARHPGVELPEHLRGNARLVLRFGYGLTPSIADLTVDDSRISGTLTFGGVPFLCKIPWAAMYAAMVEGEERGTVWPEDVPGDVLLAPADETEDAAGEAEGEGGGPQQEQPRPKRGSHLKLVD
ncbi:MAG: hypothetical protein IPI49_18435 [Myxococcales bacterium]|nr:hypothetical protein [Myxococcales bacterium]